MALCVGGLAFDDDIFNLRKCFHYTYLLYIYLLNAHTVGRKKYLSGEHFTENKDIGMKLLDVGLAPSTERAECTHKEIREGFKLG